MNGFDNIEVLVEQLRRTATVETVYGDPVSSGDRTVVPVASVGYGFGGGGGDDGIGMGGGVGVSPVGVLEITPDGTRFVRFSESRKTLAAFAVGIVLGALGRRLL
jgi:uncharacterized spore protein YtfJ